MLILVQDLDQDLIEDLVQDLDQDPQQDLNLVQEQDQDVFLLYHFI